MKTLLIRAALALGLLAAPAWADGLLPASTISAVDSSVTSTAGQNAIAVLTGTPTSGSAVVQNLNGQSMALVTVRAAWVGALAIEVSGDNGQTWSSATGLQRGTSYGVSSITGNGQFQVDVAGQTQIRIRATALTSGTPAVQINLAQGPGLVRVANPVRLFDNATGLQAFIKAGNAALTTDNALVSVDPVLAAAIANTTTAVNNTAVPLTAPGTAAAAGIHAQGAPGMIPFTIRDQVGSVDVSPSNPKPIAPTGTLLSPDTRTMSVAYPMLASVRTGTGAAESCRLVKTGASYLEAVTVQTGGTAGYLFVLDSATNAPTTLPTDGTVDTLWAFQIAANSFFGKDWSGGPGIPTTNGVLVCFSSTAPPTLTKSATARFWAQAP